MSLAVIVIVLGVPISDSIVGLSITLLIRASLGNRRRWCDTLIRTQPYLDAAVTVQLQLLWGSGESH